MAEKDGYSPSLGSVALCGVVFKAFQAHSDGLVKVSIVKDKEWKKALSRFESGVLRSLKAVIDGEASNNLLIMVLLEAVSSLPQRSATVGSFRDVMKSITSTGDSRSTKQMSQEAKDQVALILAAHTEDDMGKDLASSPCLSIVARNVVATRADRLGKTMSPGQKMELLHSSLSNSSDGLAQLLAVRHIILASQGK